MAAGHGTEARSRRHYRDGEKPCQACADAARDRKRVREGRVSRSEAQQEIWDRRRAGLLPPRRQAGQ